MALHIFGGAPYLCNMSTISEWSEVSNALTRSANTTNVSRLCCRRIWSSVFSV